MKFMVATNNAIIANPIEILSPLTMVFTSLISIMPKHQSRPAVYATLLIPMLD
jgi:hypothetical protein